MNMKLLFLSILAVSVFAFDPCPTNNRNRPACCSVDVLKVADLDCETPPGVEQFQNGMEFKQACQTLGQAPRCCTLLLTGEGIGCDDFVKLDK
ncbi:hypothetical protein N5P37_000747 [Trichoderma harzianum]|uniref:Hydrophobin n=2 Tax=Trichoderma harzianum TaxID=5544 RepID=A0A2T4AIQ3_TRIHA|nr:hypothetical protein M431DRAFT_493416 [Trichoderma harzianum CBS 226.95]AWT58108.1 hydrophobin [Trichoderma harzianum]KAK0767017.1 hypothetical protein N5P37_000747 [Trichoderma harzianum]PTB56946.1 hypothetical protein M431DRAFT_493416 [Trichoderma harzianum CBS 226.95]